MKKLVTAFAACMIAGLVTAAVESANIVGYSTLTLQPGFNMIGAQFEVVGGTAASEIALDDFIDKSNLTAGADNLTSDCIYVFTNGDYLPTYYLWDNGEGGKEWWDVSDNLPAPIKTGDAMWYLSRAGAPITATVAGQVGQAPTQVTIRAGKFSLVVNPFPVELDLTATTPVNWNTVSGPVAGADNLTSDCIYVFKDGDYLPTYYLWDNGEGGKEWWDVSDNLPVAVGVGQGFWYYSRAASDYTLEFASPL